ncbi:MAG: ABC transporter permease [Planctomycetota bacterium]
MNAIRALVLTDWKLLVRDRGALFLTFVLPPVFFAIFASIFGGMSGGDDGTFEPLRVVAIDADGTETSRAFLRALLEQEALVEAPLEAPAPTDLVGAASVVRRGDADAAVLVAKGFEASFARFWESPPRLEIVYDAANPISRFTLEGLAQASVFRAAPTALMDAGFDALEELGASTTPEQRDALDRLRVLIDGAREEGADAAADGDEPSGGAAMSSFVDVASVPATEYRAPGDGTDAASPGVVDYYAAAIGVMFLLFSMAGAAGSLLEEEERGTLERLLTSGIGLGPVLAGHFVFFALVGCAQLATMFAFGAVVFGMHLSDAQVVVGLLVVGATTAAAASAFALMLATACRTRAQLAGLSTVVILVMSALGGSMVPRFVMPAFMNSVSHFTFNGWALDGFQAVLWRRDPNGSMADLLGSVALPVAVLLLATVAFFVVARRLARRWETI